MISAKTGTNVAHGLINLQDYGLLQECVMCGQIYNLRVHLLLCLCCKAHVSSSSQSWVASAKIFCSPEQPYPLEMMSK